jgi:GTP cyclohydrolase II
LYDEVCSTKASRASAVCRALSDLRRGQPVLVEGEGEAALVSAAEVATGESLTAMQAHADGLARVALTAERARVLGFAPGLSKVVTVPLTPGLGTETIRWLADPTVPANRAVRVLTRADAAPPLSPAAGGVGLAKLAQLLPAAICAPLPSMLLGELDDFAREHDVLRVTAQAIRDYPADMAATLRPVSEARVPLATAEEARVVGFRPADGSIEQFAVLVGRPERHQPTLCRLHSECFTGDLLGSLRCDCGPQLQQALRLMAADGHGVLLYLAHEGRGIGLINKLRAYQLQDAGLDTVDANESLGFESDERDFRIASVMLQQLGIDAVRLMTNNPTKITGLRNAGIEVVERVPHELPATSHNRGYLATKASRSGHLLELIG